MISKDIRKYALSRKQERIRFKEGIPLLEELKDQIPEFRVTTEGLVEYVRFNNVIYKKVFIREDTIDGVNVS